MHVLEPSHAVVRRPPQPAGRGPVAHNRDVLGALPPSARGDLRIRRVGGEHVVRDSVRQPLAGDPEPRKGGRAELDLHRLGEQVVMIEHNLAAAGAVHGTGRKQDVRGVVDMQHGGAGEQFAQRRDVQRNRGHRVLGDESPRSTSTAVDQGEADHVDAVDAFAARLTARSRRDHGHAVSRAGQRLGLGAHPHILRIRVVLEQHRDPLTCGLAHRPINASPVPELPHEI